MSVTPTGLLAAPLENARQLLAHSSTWQTWTGHSANPTLAAGHVHLIAPTAPDEETYDASELALLRPGAVVSPGPQWAATLRACQGYTGGGSVHLHIEAAVNPLYEDSESDSELDFLNNLGAVIHEMLALDEGLGYLVPTVIRMMEPPQRMSIEDRESEGDYYQADLLLTYEGGPA